MHPKKKKQKNPNRLSRFVELSPEQLRLKCNAIKARWSPATRKKREVQSSPQWELPTVSEVH